MNNQHFINTLQQFLSNNISVDSLNNLQDLVFNYPSNNDNSLLLTKYKEKFVKYLEEDDIEPSKYNDHIRIILENKIDIFNKNEIAVLTNTELQKEILEKYNFTNFTLDTCEDKYLIYLVSLLHRMNNNFNKAIEYLDLLVNKFKFIRAIIDLGEYYEVYLRDYNKAESYYQLGLVENNIICIRGLCYCYIKTKNDLLLEAMTNKLRENNDYAMYPDIIHYYFTNRKNDIAMMLILEGIENGNNECYYNLAIYYEKVDFDIYSTTLNFILGINKGSEKCQKALNTYLSQFYNNDVDMMKHLLTYKEFIKLNPLYSKMFINTLEIYKMLFDENDNLILDESQITTTEKVDDSGNTICQIKYDIYEQKDLDNIREFVLNSKLVKYYKSAQLPVNIKEQCFICGTTKDEGKQLNSVLLECEHYMCISCFDNVSYKNECPYCREQIYDNKKDLDTINKLFNLTTETEVLDYNPFIRYLNNIYRNNSANNNVQQEENVEEEALENETIVNTQNSNENQNNIEENQTPGNNDENIEENQTPITNDENQNENIQMNNSNTYNITVDGINYQFFINNNIMNSESFLENFNSIISNIPNNEISSSNNEQNNFIDNENFSDDDETLSSENGDENNENNEYYENNENENNNTDTESNYSDGINEELDILDDETLDDNYYY